MVKKRLKQTLALVLALSVILTNSQITSAAQATEVAALEAAAENPESVDEENVEEVTAEAEETVSESETKAEEAVEETVSETAEEAAEETAVEETEETAEVPEVAETEETKEVQEEAEAEEVLTYEAEAEGIKVIATANKGVVPEGAVLKVAMLGEKESAEVEESLNENDVAFDGFLALDVAFQKDGAEVEPEGNVNVAFEIPEAVISEIDETADLETVEIQHLVENEATGEVEAVETVAEAADVAVEGDTVVAEAEVESFSRFTITWGSSSTATVIFVDRTGTELTGVTTADGTSVDGQRIAVTNAGVDLSTYKKEGYTYSNTRLDSYTGTAISAKLTRSGNNNVQYSYVSRDSSSIQKANLSKGKYIYVIMDPAADYTAPGSSEGDDPTIGDAPAHSKTLTENADGTYTLSLDVTGQSASASKSGSVNILFVVDTSGSMGWNEDGSNYNPGEQDKRIYKTRNALKAVAASLLANNTAEHPNAVQLNLFNFATNADNTNRAWTNYAPTFNDYVDACGSNGGTNWEAAMQSALTKSVPDDDPTYVIFFTDGVPTYYKGTNDTKGPGNCNDDCANLISYTARDEVRALINRGNTTLYGIFAFGKTSTTSLDGTDILKGTINYAYGNTDESADTKYFKAASDEAGLVAALTEILNDITKSAGFEDVEITDGMTSLTSLVNGTAGDFKYYKGTQEWTDITESQKAKLVDGAVVWDLGENFVLENGVTYKVSFTVWPSQRSYDIIAALNNGTITYGDVTAVVNGEAVTADEWSQIDETTHGLKTNTDASIKYTTINTTTRDSLPAGAVQTGDTATYTDAKGTWTYVKNSDGKWVGTLKKEGSAGFTNPDPLPLQSAKMNVSKAWADTLTEGEDRPTSITLQVYQDGEEYLDPIVLSNENGWTKEIAIAPGVLVAANQYGAGADGVLETGHVYTVREISYTTADGTVHEGVENHYEASITPVQPMMNGLTTSDTTDMKDKLSDTVWTDATAELTATNTVKGGVNVTKQVTDAAGNDISDSVDAEFEFTITLKDADGNPVGTPADSVSGDLGYRIFEADGTRIAKADIPDGTITLKIKPGQVIRVVNIPQGTKYTVTEGTTAGYELDTAKTTGTTGEIKGNDTYTAAFVNVSKSGNLKFTKTIKGLTSDQLTSLKSALSFTVTGPAEFTETEIKANDAEKADWDVSEDEKGNPIATVTIELNDVPVGNYTITENNYEISGLTAYTDGSVKVAVEAGKTADAALENVYNPDQPEGKDASYQLTKKWVDESGKDASAYATATSITAVVVQKDGNGTEINRDTLVLTKDNNWTADYTKPVYAYTTFEIVSETNTTTGKALTPSATDADGTVTSEITLQKYEPCKDLELTFNGSSFMVVNKGSDYAIWSLYEMSAAAKAEVKKAVAKEIPAFKPDQTTFASGKDAKLGGFTIAWTDATATKGASATITFDGSKVWSLIWYGTYSYSGTVDASISNTVETTEVTVEKIWNDADLAKEAGNLYKRPEVTVYLLADGNTVTKADGSAYTVVLDGTADTTGETAAWKASFTNLPKYAEGKEIVYTAKEISVAGYSVVADALKVTNTPIEEEDYTEVPLTIKKVDGNTGTGLATATFDVAKINADGSSTALGTTEATGSDGTVSYTFKAPGTYTIKEAGAPEGYNLNTVVYNVVVEKGAIKSVTVTEKEDKTSVLTKLYELIFGTGTGYSKGTLTIIDTPKPVEVTVNKKWDDNDNQDGKRTSYKVTLYANGEAAKDMDGKTLAEVTVDAAESSYTWKNLPGYADGKAIVYTIKETGVPAGYTATYGTDADGKVLDAAAAGGTITNSYSPETVKYSFTKTWDDADNQDGKRPEAITVTVKNGDTVADTVIITEDAETKAWTGTTKDLPVYADGEKIVYTISEADITGYEAEIGTPKLNEKTGIYEVAIENTHEPEVKKYSFTKTWTDADDQDGKRPDKITVNVMNGEDVADTVEIKEDAKTKTWTGTTKELPVYADGKEIEYTISEADITGYEAEIGTPELNEETGIYEVAIENTHEPETKKYSFTKTWTDADDQDGKRPESITVTVKNGETVADTVIITEDAETKTWTGTTKELPVYADGKEIEYTISEAEITDYEAEIGTPKLNETTGIYEVAIENTHEPEVKKYSFTKTWTDADNQDGKRPEKITVNVMNGEEVADTVEITEDAETKTWTGTTKDLPVYADGKEIEYKISEAEVKDYEATIGTPKLNETTGIYEVAIENTHEPEVKKYSFTKTWTDADDQDGKRPESITVTVKNGETIADTVEITENAETKTWTGTTKELPVYADGKEIEYTISEAEITDYEAEIGTPKLNETTGIYEVAIENIHKPEVKQYTFTKTWADADDQDGKRPDMITVNVMNGEEVAATVQITEDAETKTWTGTTKALPVYDDGKEIEYTISEAEITGYEAEIGKPVYNTETGIYEVAIENTHEPETKKYSFTKTWTDAEDQDGVRPDKITVYVKNGDTTAATVEMTEATGWAGTTDDLDVYAGGEVINYTITEAEIDGYEAEIGEPELNEETGIYEVAIENTHEPSKIDIEGKKVWYDFDDQDGVRPTEITVKLQKLEDGKLVDVEDVDPITLSAGEDGDWQDEELSFKFEGLDEYAKGEKIEYSVLETGMTQQEGVEKNAYIPYYKSSTSEDEAISEILTSEDFGQYDILNAYDPEKTTVTVKKSWVDLGEDDERRPDSITVVLDADNKEGFEPITAELNEENGWEYTFENLDKYTPRGILIEYTVDEYGLSDYEATIELVEETGTEEVPAIFTIVNTVKYGSIKLTKSLENYNATLDGATFVFDIQGEYTDEYGNTETYSEIYSMKFAGDGSQTYTITGLPVGMEFTVTEVYSGVYTAAKATDAGTVKADEVTELKFSNTRSGKLIYGGGVINTYGDGVDQNFDETEDNEKDVKERYFPEERPL